MSSFPECFCTFLVLTAKVWEFFFVYTLGLNIVDILLFSPRFHWPCALCFDTNLKSLDFVVKLSVVKV
jgi:hypothetical protein